MRSCWVSLWMGVDEKGGDVRMEIDLWKVNVCLLECVKVVGASRRLLRSVGVHIPQMSGLERDLRERAAEIQEWLKEQAEKGEPGQE